MTICDKCPCFAQDDLNEYCKITEKTACWDKNNVGLSINLMHDTDCPLDHIVLKDGTVFRPEVVE